MIDFACWVTDEDPDDEKLAGELEGFLPARRKSIVARLGQSTIITFQKSAGRESANTSSGPGPSSIKDPNSRILIPHDEAKSVLNQHIAGGN